MERIIDINNTLIDLGNIKSVINDSDAMSYSDGYLIINLLRGREYVYNPDTKETVLIEPQIKIFGSFDKIAVWFDEVKEKWNKYMIEMEKLK